MEKEKILEIVNEINKIARLNCMYNKIEEIGEKYDSESDYASIKRWVIHKIEELERRYKKINNTKSNYKFNYE